MNSHHVLFACAMFLAVFQCSPADWGTWKLTHCCVCFTQLCVNLLILPLVFQYCCPELLVLFNFFHCFLARLDSLGEKNGLIKFSSTLRVQIRICFLHVM